jgi:hypothetical protein
MAKWRKESEKTIKGTEEGADPQRGEAPEAEPASEAATTARTAPETRPETTASGRGPGPGHRSRRRDTDGGGLRTGVRRVSGLAANLVGIATMIICVLLALHIAFVVFSANDHNAIVSAVNRWADWFAWRFHDIFVPKDERVGVLVNYGIAAVVYLIAGRVVSGLIRRVR